MSFRIRHEIAVPSAIGWVASAIGVAAATLLAVALKHLGAI